MIILHDHLNPTQEVIVDENAITAIAPFGSGSSVQCEGQGVVAVHETPSEVYKLKREAKGD